MFGKDWAPCFSCKNWQNLFETLPIYLGVTHDPDDAGDSVTETTMPAADEEAPAKVQVLSSPILNEFAAAANDSTGSSNRTQEACCSMRILDLRAKARFHRIRGDDVSASSSVENKQRLTDEDELCCDDRIIDLIKVSSSSCFQKLTESFTGW